MASNAVFQFLADTHGRFAQVAKGLPAEVKITPTRKLIAFSLLGADYVVPLEEVSEILDVPQMTRLPRVKNWVKGVANVRGRLMPIIDFADFRGGKLTPTIRDRRVMVFEVNNVYVGVIVDGVQGLQKIPVDRYRREYASNLALAPYLEGHYGHAGRNWPLFRPYKLIMDSTFMSVSE